MILFQDMLEVVTRDIMMEDHINILVDSSMVDQDIRGWSPLNINYLHLLEQ